MTDFNADQLQRLRPVEHHRPTVEVDGVPLADGFPVRKLVLEVLSGPEHGQSFICDRPNLRIGADPLCDMVLTDPTVSRNHAEVRQRGQNFVLVDLKSTNGTFLNNNKIDNAMIQPGEIFRCGRSKLRFDVRTEKVEIHTTERTHYDNIIGQSQALREIFSILDRVAPSELSVVIEGETGSGKELIARAIHDHSARKDGPFVVFDCSAFPASLLESELFGHEKGSFTGAVGRHVGVFERADGGTLFFDELGELDMEFQAKFLRVLETGQVRRVGGEKTITVDVRVVAATNRNLEEMVHQRTFRSDLFYRLAQVRFLLPPLRDRLEDIPILIEHFLDLQAERMGRRPMLAMESISVLQTYHWPGNIRQLRNVIEKAVAMCRDGLISADYLRTELGAMRRQALTISGAGAPKAPPASAPQAPFVPASAPTATHHAGQVSDFEPAFTAPTQAPAPSQSMLSAQGVVTVSATMLNRNSEVLPFKDVKEEIISAFERQYLETLLEKTGMNISRAARRAGIDRRHFYRLLNKHDISTDDGQDDD